MNIVFKKITQVILFLIRKVFFFFPYSEVSVLCYHAVDNQDNWNLSVSPKDFEKQIKYLRKNHYYFCSIEDLIKHVKGELILPRKTVHLTFDDGYRSVYMNAFPILQREKIPATIFVLGDFDNSKEERGTDRHGLFENEIAEMKQSGLIEFGYHSRSHKMLGELEGEELINEVKNDYQHKYFAYPGGSWGKGVLGSMTKFGYEAAFTIGPGLIKEDDNIFGLKRNVILRNMSMFDFAIRTNKVIEWYTGIVKTIKGKKK